MYACAVPGPEKQPQLREFLDEPDTPLTFEWPHPPGFSAQMARSHLCPRSIYKYWLLMRGMVENYCPRGEIQPLPTIRPQWIVGKGWILPMSTIIFYHSPNKRAVNICFIRPIHRFFSPYRIVKSGKYGIEFQIWQLWQLLRESGK